MTTPPPGDASGARGGHAGLALPPVLHNAAGAVRSLGVELEFSGLDVETAADLVRDVLGGRLDPVSPYECQVRDTDLGDFGVGLDYAYLKRQGREQGPDADGSGGLERWPEHLLAEIARRVVPLEIVSPPFPMPRLGQLEPLVERLRQAGAEGTRGSPLYAFGLHFNPELPRLDADTIGAYLRAFLCLYDWLAEVSGVDWTRRLTPYVDAFPREYVVLVTAPGYAPSLDRLMDDYLQHNPDRNRALDMLPLFARLDEDRVRAAVDDPRIKPRPTLHYRLPNSDVDRPGWNLSTAWGHYLQVERLACDRPRLADMAARYHEHLSRDVPDDPRGWARICERWLSVDDR